MITSDILTLNKSLCGLLSTAFISLQDHHWDIKQLIQIIHVTFAPVPDILEIESLTENFHLWHLPLFILGSPWCQHILLMVMLTSIMWLRWWLPGVISIKLLIFFFIMNKYLVVRFSETMQMPCFSSCFCLLILGILV